ncbi:hypothetical protein PHMEG_0001821 [Phytophthora megakarya]|uniref:Transmembrane protein n=1 Tax=Phytophthora megakarya TaxID=4795 RepID=A0A225X0P5_9STRA|nr:hypothetical protein PHMEG_0001821 [Phytophthora megakarya]
MAELRVHSGKLEGFPPFPTWNGTIAAPLTASRGLCSVLGADGELVVLQLLQNDDDPSASRLGIVKVLQPVVEKFSSFCQCWTNDGAIVATAHDATVVFYSTKGFEVLLRLQMQHCVTSMDITRNRTAEEEMEFVFLVGTTFGASLYKVSLCNKRPGVIDSEGESNAGFHRPSPVARVHDGVAVCMVKLSSDGCIAAIGSMDGRLFLRRLHIHEDGTLATFGSAVLSKVLQAPRITSMSFSSCNTNLVVATRKGNVYVFTCSSETGQWETLLSCKDLSGNPKPKGTGVAGTNKAATAAQTLVACWGPVFVVCSRAITSRLEVYDFASGRLLHSLQFAPAVASSPALNQWVDQQLVTGVCGWNLPGSTRLLIHDSSANVAVVEWPFLDAPHLASVWASSYNPFLMEAAKRPALLVGGIALSSLGVLPLLEVGFSLRQASSPEKMQVLLTLTTLDKSAITLSALLAVLGGALLALHWVELPVNAALKTAKLLATALAVAALIDAALLTSVASHRGPDTPWKAEVYADHEGLFEQRMNDVFCHAKGLQVCELGSVAEARQIFPLQNWPVDSDRAPGRGIATSCEGFKDSVQLWGYQSKMELCRLCGNITHEEQQLQTELGAEHTAEVLAAVDLLRFEELQCLGSHEDGDISSNWFEPTASGDNETASGSGEEEYKFYADVFTNG